ncbi:MAG TPA: hypothetical protein VFT10_04960 [Solirubrobacterales bacterium]|nr:hypothetical protein [Solirubrobacterales bacterium]
MHYEDGRGAAADHLGLIGAGVSAICPSRASNKTSANHRDYEAQPELVPEEPRQLGDLPAEAAQADRLRQRFSFEVIVAQRGTHA